MAEPTKQTSLDHICRRLGLPMMLVGDPGSSVPVEVFHGAATQFGIDPSGQMPVVGERIARAAGLEWTAACDSRQTASRGGSTVTRTGMRVLAQAVDILIDRQNRAAEPHAEPVGLPYIEAVGGIDATPTIVEQDWAAHDKATRTHAETQNALAELIAERGLAPLSPLPGGPRFDLAWRCSSGLVVVEVKSITAANSSQQCRLGLGQVLEYRYLLQGPAEPRVSPVLVTSADPTDLYRDLGRSVGVTVIAAADAEQGLGELLTPP